MNAGDHEHEELLRDYDIAVSKLHMPQPERFEDLANPEVLARWLDDHGMRGVWRRWAAEHGHADHCPDWCTSGHDPIRILAGSVAGTEHDHAGIEVGEVHAHMYRMVGVDGSEVFTEDRICIRLPGDPNPVDMALADREALIAALQGLPLPG